MLPLLVHAVPAEERLARLQMMLSKLALLLLIILTCFASMEVQKFTKQQIASLSQRFLYKFRGLTALCGCNTQLHVRYQIIPSGICVLKTKTLALKLILECSRLCQQLMYVVRR